MVNSKSSSSNGANCVKNALVSIIHSEGISILDNPKKIRALLLDYCSGENKREIILLEQLLNEQIHKDLVRQKDTMPYPIISVNLTQKILGTYPFDEAQVRGGVDTLAIALGIIQSAPKTQQKSVIQPPKRIQKNSPLSPAVIKVAKTYDVTIYSEPIGAQVFINGKFRGPSPLSIPLSKGTFLVSCTYPNYEDWMRDITVPNDLYVRVDLIKKQQNVSNTSYSNPLSKAPTPENQGIFGKIKGALK